MATTSQKIIEIKFFVRILGALTPPPRIDEPVMKMPLCIVYRLSISVCTSISAVTDHAAPTTESPMQSAIPVPAHAWGENLRRCLSDATSARYVWLNQSTHVECLSLSIKQHVWRVVSSRGSCRRGVIEKDVQSPMTVRAVLAP
jgi:hypothetical protein